ncbi:MAG: hypothetical protein KA004_06210 [Verrucomicrobiales bacterium]|nr:hypothetical protein [Verrucomicrobiales bacterium]
MRNTLLFLTAGLFGFGCKTTSPQSLRGSTYLYVPEKGRDSGPALDSAQFPPTTRSESMQLAEAYLTHEWLPTSRNVFHGIDPDGIRVDTPDSAFKPAMTLPGWWVAGLMNRGIPYQWGGFSTPEEFDAGLAAGKYAGDIYTLRKRALLDGAVSRHAVGIDCSGFVSRCWRLPRSYSTRELPQLCDELANWDDLLPGDILNTRNEHVLLFAQWHDAAHTALIVYETGSPPMWKVQRHPLMRKPLADWGYRAYRYRNMRD